jgi:hypothetical protein
MISILGDIHQFSAKHLSILSKTIVVITFSAKMTAF